VPHRLDAVLAHQLFEQLGIGDVAAGLQRKLDDFVAARAKRMDDVGADEPACARHQNSQGRKLGKSI